jgi:hypothetical protein
MHEELNPITRLQPKMFTDRFRDSGLTLNGDRGFHLTLHYKLINVIPRSQSTRQADNSPNVLHLSGLDIVVLGSQERHTARTPPEALVMDSSTDCDEDA